MSDIMRQAWELIGETESTTGRRPAEIVVTQEEYDVLLRGSATDVPGMDVPGMPPVGMEIFGIPLRVIEDEVDEEERRSRLAMVGAGIRTFATTVRVNVAEFDEAITRLGAAAQVWAGHIAHRTDEEICLGLVESMKPEWTIRLDDLNGHSLVCRVGSWGCNQPLNIPEGAEPVIDNNLMWTFLQNTAMLEYADWISEPRRPGQRGGVTEQAFQQAIGYRVDPELIVAPEDIPGVTWRDRERWIRELDTVPDEEPHDESGGLSSEELMEAIGMAVDEWKEEKK